MSAPSSPFALAVCQPGTERWLKAEVVRARPELHPAFQRPGLVTFKSSGAPFAPTDVVPSVFARHQACSAGPAADPAAALAVAERVGAVRLHLGPRDQGVPGEVPPARQEAADAQAAAWAAELRASGRFHEGAPVRGEVVLDVITSPDEPAVVGWHVHGPGRPEGPLGRYAIPAPEGAPSRAWRKLEEGVRWAGVDLRPGELVLDVGAAPGGATRALVDRGLRVIAVDPEPLDAALSEHPLVTWIQRPIAEVRTEDLPDDVAWITCDANIAPPRAIGAVRRLVPRFRRTLRGLLLTLKLNDERTVQDLPRWLDQVRALGCTEVLATQLPSNRRDVFVFGRMPGRRARRRG